MNAVCGDQLYFDHYMWWKSTFWWSYVVIIHFLQDTHDNQLLIDGPMFLRVDVLVHFYIYKVISNMLMVVCDDKSCLESYMQWSSAFWQLNMVNNYFLMCICCDQPTIFGLFMMMSHFLRVICSDQLILLIMCGDEPLLELHLSWSASFGAPHVVITQFWSSTWLYVVISQFFFQIIYHDHDQPLFGGYYWWPAPFTMWWLSTFWGLYVVINSMLAIICGYQPLLELHM